MAVQTDEEREPAVAFSDEQIKRLKIAFDSIRAREKPYQRFIEGDAMRLAKLLKILRAKGLVTRKEIREIGEIYVEAVSAFKAELEVLEYLEELDVVELILRGEVVGVPIIEFREEKEQEEALEPKGTA